MSNQTNELKNMMASFFQMNTTSYLGSGSLLGNSIANPKGELKAITTRSGLVLDGPSVPMPPPFINPEEDEHAEETLTDPEVTEYTIKYQKMLKSLFSNKEKLLELANTSLNENCSAVILKKLPEKLGDPGKFLILCGFSELKRKALADLGASINLMPLSVWKKLGLPELISTRMTLELANRVIYTPAGIARDVFVQVRKFTFPADFVIVDYESDPRVLLILGRPFLWTARALIDVHKEEMILRDGDEKLTLNMRHDTLNLFATNHLSGNPTPISDPIVSSSPTLTSLEEYDLIWEEFEAYLRQIPNNDLLITIPEIFTDELLCLFTPPLYDDVHKILSSDFLPSPECDSVLYDDFSDVDALPSTNNEDKVFNPGILIHENLFEVTIRVTPDKNEKKISISNASLILEDFNHSLFLNYPFLHKEVSGSETLTSRFHPK
ncbi:reverse transcriptase domain-containing protein [Tanacetum coccineum]